MQQFRRFLALIFAVVVACGLVTAARAVPTDAVILTVTGDIAHKDGKPVEFGREALEALGLHRIQTSTPWTDGISIFEGVLLSDLLDHVGARGSVAHAHALNNYEVDIPVEDFRRYPVLLALRRDGHELDRRDKGPIWIVYPRDAHPELQTAIINSRWVWQLDRLELR